MIQNGGNKYEFYFVHATKKLNNVLNIISDGVLHLGSNVDARKRFLSGIDSKPYIFMNMYFKKLKNLDCLMDYTLIIHPKIMKDYDIYFNKGWGGGPSPLIKNAIVLYKNDIDTITDKKIKKIKRFIKNPKNIPDIVINGPGFLHHECVFIEEINIKKYLIGIVCTNIKKNEKQKLQKLLKEHRYNNVIIYEKRTQFLK